MKKDIQKSLIVQLIVKTPVLKEGEKIHVLIESEEMFSSDESEKMLKLNARLGAKLCFKKTASEKQVSKMFYTVGQNFVTLRLPEKSKSMHREVSFFEMNFLQLLDETDFRKVKNQPHEADRNKF